MVKITKEQYEKEKRAIEKLVSEKEKGLRNKILEKVKGLEEKIEPKSILATKTCLINAIQNLSSLSFPIPKKSCLFVLCDINNAFSLPISVLITSFDLYSSCRLRRLRAVCSRLIGADICAPQ